MKKQLPVLKNEEDVQEFWSQEDSTDYVDWSKAQRVIFPNLRPSLKTISIRLPEIMIEQLKLLANQRDVPYQSLLKIYLAERIQEEVERHSVKSAK